MAGLVIEFKKGGNKIMTKRENELKGLFLAIGVIEKRRKKIKEKLVFPYRIDVSGKPSYKEVFKSLQCVFRNNHSRWVDLEFVFRWKAKDKPIGYPFIKMKVFFLGNRKFTLKNIKEIAGRIANGEKWQVGKAGISKRREFDIIDFI